MKRVRPRLLRTFALLSSLAACESQESGVFVTVLPEGSPIERVTAFEVAVDISGRGAGSLRLDLAGETTVGEQTFTIRFAQGVKGTAKIEVTARGAQNAELGRGSIEMVALEGGKFVAIVIRLKATSGTGDGGPDGTGGDGGIREGSIEGSADTAPERETGGSDVGVEAADRPPDTPAPEVPVGADLPGPEPPGPEPPGPESPGPEPPGPELPGPELPGPESPPENPVPEPPGPESPGPEFSGPEPPSDAARDMPSEDLCTGVVCSPTQSCCPCTGMCFAQACLSCCMCPPPPGP